MKLDLFIVVNDDILVDVFVAWVFLQGGAANPTPNPPPFSGLGTGTG